MLLYRYIYIYIKVSWYYSVMTKCFKKQSKKKIYFLAWHEYVRHNSLYTHTYIYIYIYVCVYLKNIFIHIYIYIHSHVYVVCV